MEGNIPCPLSSPRQISVPITDCLSPPSRLSSSLPLPCTTSPQPIVKTHLLHSPHVNQSQGGTDSATFTVDKEESERSLRPQKNVTPRSRPGHTAKCIFPPIDKGREGPFVCPVSVDSCTVARSVNLAAVRE